MQIGYTFFRKNRPSWIVKGKIEECVQNCHSLLTFLGSCSACKTGEQAASILKSCFFHLIKHLETAKKETCSDVGISALIEIFCKEINDVVMHNLFDIKHLMQHEVIQIHFIYLIWVFLIRRDLFDKKSAENSAGPTNFRWLHRIFDLIIESSTRNFFFKYDLDLIYKI
jgi:hypothetical protein